MIDKALVAAVRRELKAAADPSRAPAMQAYMKSAMPYYGVGMPGQQVIWKKLFRTRVIPDARSWRETTLAIWRGAKFREERYGAIALTGEKAYLPWQTLDALPMYEEMIVTGAWWDYVDHIAGRRIGLLLRNHPASMSRLMHRWSRSDDMWKRRRRSSASSGSRNGRTWRSSTTASNPTSTIASSSSARRLAGRCASTRGPTRRKCSDMCARTRIN